MHGATAGLKSDQQRRLKALYRRRGGRKELLSLPLAKALAEVTRDVGRRIGVLIDRAGAVAYVVVGDAHRVQLPDLGPRRAGAARFRGLRLILTGTRPGGLTEEDLTDLVLLQLDAVVSLLVGVDGVQMDVHWAHLLPPEPGGARWAIEHKRFVHEVDVDFGVFIRDLEGQYARHPALRTVGTQESAILLGLTLGDATRARRSLAELSRLAVAAGLNVVDAALQVRKALDPRTCIGRGKLQELLVRSMHLGAGVLVFDRELSPSQLRNIAETTDLKVLDRTQLILDLFAKRATTRDGRMQVELAQLRYRMPRLAIMPTAMSRLTGGVGGRGPGETRLEINKRRAQERADRLARELAARAAGRAVRRARRKRAGLPIVSLVGYTNAGKSTLLNTLTGSHVHVADALFATLDTTSRRLRFPQEREILVTDTVGFIEDLPATLVAAFRSTLEELDEADLLVHVVDAADPEAERHIVAVLDVLEGLGLANTPLLRVWNKSDCIAASALAERLGSWGGVATSALTGAGMDRLLDAVERRLFSARLEGTT